MIELHLQWPAWPSDDDVDEDDDGDDDDDDDDDDLDADYDDDDNGLLGHDASSTSDQVLPLMGHHTPWLKGRPDFRLSRSLQTEWKIF